MRFLIDENLPIEIKALLHRRGHNATHALDRTKPGRSDSALYRIAQKERRVIVTCDLDFSDIRRFPPGTHYGIIVLRLQIQSTPRLLGAFEGFMRAGTINRCVKAIAIVEETGYRVRSVNIVE